MRSTYTVVSNGPGEDAGAICFGLIIMEIFGSCAYRRVIPLAILTLTNISRYFILLFNFAI